VGKWGVGIGKWHWNISGLAGQGYEHAWWIENEGVFWNWMEYPGDSKAGAACTGLKFMIKAGTEIDHSFFFYGSRKNYAFYS